ncbi:TPA: hypothetical protein DIS56_03650 [Candidatus Saccharibacteria bacterium]|nr:MAG: hypothetical protein A3F05_00820 [Candidatus Saccharibacteria bacterium RIFCSPHIGHO2_12_FULL_47_17]HCM52194.1 hypothetical protein [Candidatus Saccharibacteria bacterium]
MWSPYLTWLVIFMVIPTIVLILLRFKQLWPYRSVILVTVIAALLVGLPWDYFAAKTKIWGWNEQCCSLPTISGLPLEEFLFITLAGIFISALTITIKQVLNKKGG